MAKFVFSIDGPIGAGKTTALEYLEKNKDQFDHLLNEGEKLVTIPEVFDPVFLDLFYNHRQNPFEAQIITELFEGDCEHKRVGRHLKAKYGPHIYCFDRTLIVGVETFARNSHQSRYLTHDAWARLQERLLRSLDQLNRLEQPRWLEQLVVYLRVKDPKVLHERAMARKRPEETEISLDYLTQINDRYERLFQEKDEVYHRYGLNSPEVLEIDASVDFRQDPNYHQNILERVVQKLGGMLDGK